MVAAGQTIGARAQLAWRMVVPTHTRIDGEFLEWQQGTIFWEEEPPEPYRVKLRTVSGPECLKAFAALAGKKPSQFPALARSFARRFGPLLAVNAASEKHISRLYSVVWPVFDAQDLPAREDASGLWRQEPLAQWREWAEYVRFVLHVSYRFLWIASGKLWGHRREEEKA